MSWDEDSDDSFTIKKPQVKSGKKNQQPKGKKRDEPLYIKRDIAEGRAFNNSFTGPYPDDTDHLHQDKGANP